MNTKTSTSGGRDMQSVTSRRMPFKNSQMNFFFVVAMGADMYGGASMGECYYAADRIREGNIESWIAAFGEIAGHVEAQAGNLLAAGHTSSACEAFLRATNYYYAADHYTDSAHPQYHAFWGKSVECFKRACALFDPVIETPSIPYDDRTLPGYFVHAQGAARGTLLAMSGFDGTAESLYFTVGAGLSRRGYNVLMFEGPGQRGVSHLYPDSPMRPDYEVPIKAVVDYALSRSDVTPDRLGLIGYSLGGHLVLRGAAYDPRIQALVADSPVTDFGKMILDDFPAFLKQLPPHIADPLMARGIRWQPQTLQASLKRLYESMGVATISQLFDRLGKLRFTEVERIACPALCLLSEGEGISAVREARQVYEALPNPRKALVSFSAQDGGDVHCQCNNRVLANQAIADWLDEIWS